MRAHRATMMMTSLSGVQEVAPKLDERIDEIHGLWDYNGGALRRLDGKLLNSTGGSFWTLKQLKFRGRRAFVSRDDGSMIGIEDAQPLSGIVFPYPEYPNPPGYNFPEDWPEDSPQSNNELGEHTPGDNPAGPTRRTDNRDIIPMGLTAIPNFVEFDTNEDEDGATRSMRIKKSNATDGAGAAVRVVWHESAPWMSLRYMGPAAEQGVQNGDLIPLGAWSDLDGNDIILQVKANIGGLEGVDGTYVNTLMFTVVEWSDVLPSDGTAYCTAAAKLIARGPELLVSTGDPTWDATVDDAT